MAENSAIEWCDHTFNPWVGCTKVGPGCDHCYAENLMDTRYGRVQWGAGNPRSRTSPANWKLPLKWNRDADAFMAAHGRRQRVFCASLADVFDNEVDPEWRFQLIDLIYSTPKLDWLLLTKRVGNVAPMLAAIGKQLGRDSFRLLDNVWLGITVVNQEEADRDVPKLLDVLAPVRWLSCEPLLGPIALTREYLVDRLGPPYPFPYISRKHRTTRLDLLDWVVVGGESGKGARPMHPDWARDLRDQCAEAGVPFLFKQWGEWAPGECASGLAMTQTERTATWWDSEWQFGHVTPRQSAEMHRDDEPDLYRIGKKAAGRLLDGVQHDGYPA